MGSVKKAFLFFTVILFAVNPFLAKANEASVAPDSQDKEIKSYIEHHLQDDHYFSLYTDKEAGKTYGFSLPVILIDGGLKVFLSGAFDHGHAVVEKDGQYYALHHGKIYKTDAEGTLNGYEYHKDETGKYITLKDANGKEQNQEFEASYKINSHELHEAHDFHPTNAKALDFSITKNVLGLILTAILLFWGFISLANTYKKGANNLPKGVGRVLEPLVLYVRDEMAIPNIGHRYKEFMPYLLSVFFLILVLNLLGLTPLGFNVTGNITITFCLAIFTFLFVNIKANKDYWKHIFWMPGVPVPFKVVLAPIEVLGMFTKPFSLMVRLFANITAGHTVIMGLIAVVYLLQNQLTLGGSIGVSMLLTTFLMVIELLVAFLQAFIFTMMSSLFIGMAVEEHNEAHH
ncbi:F0F1 ATP synthase subunit A [Sphingobacterium sp. SRCM116780]|uniref:F0F1 ATP synthase subunit A n=1 Tax=Sphingobacterium sp. SRCM116780 TaxID=2907623 RepID=UPI001F198B52|nr:F0F1 ATP synthase subunit A [Sphingobacterium sp. SRCM116780]UIR55044.1 F0F1 ATP synthase subunit A [Sphingobacterium sp. SRCM116780]